MKLNYLLIMPKFLDNTAGEKIFPLGIAYISSSMKKAGFRVFNLNLNLSHGSLTEELEQRMVKDEIDVVLTGGLSFQYSILYEIVSAVHSLKIKLKKDIKIVVGGGIVTGDPENAMKALDYVDYGVIGEGEVTVCELCRALEEKSELSAVEGIIYRRDDKWIRNPDRADIQDLDRLPFPDYEGFDFGAHLDDTNQEESSFFDTRKQINNVYIIGSRSCPFNCTFCFHTCGKKYRQRSLDNIFEELDYLVQRYKIKNIIGIQDELISYDKNRILEFCRRIKHYGLGWWGQFRVDTMDLEVLQALKDSNCQVMAFGIESADNRILKSMRKGTTIEQIEKTLRLAYEAGMPFVGTLLYSGIRKRRKKLRIIRSGGGKSIWSIVWI